MKVLWILYVIACPNCDIQLVNTYETKQECLRYKKSNERMRQGIYGYYGYPYYDPTRFECEKQETIQ